MNRFALILTLTLLSPFSHHGQEAEAGRDGAQSLEQVLLLSDLKALETEAAKLTQPLAYALAKAEIADVAWAFDQEWAERLLTESYELTFPDEKTRESLRTQPADARPALLTAEQRARGQVSRRVFQIASRDRAFAKRLAELGAEQLGPREAHYKYTELAARAVAAGDLKAAGEYVIRAIEAEPALITVSGVITDVAARDRKAADELILQCMERQRAALRFLGAREVPLAFFMLSDLIFSYNKSFFSGSRDDPRYRQIPPPGPAVMRAYVGFVIDAVSLLEQREPGSLRRLRGTLLMAGTLLKQYAPELAPAFSELESRSRRPGDDITLPTRESMERSPQERYEKLLKEALKSDQPDEMIIHSAISRGDFASARKLIDKLNGGPQKTQLLEMANMREATSLAHQGDSLAAERLAEQLNKATSILAVYPVLLKQCVAKKDQACASALVYQAMKQLKRADTTPHTPPPGIPASAIPSSREFDPALLSLSQLAKVVAPLNDVLALEVLDETVAAANRSEIDTAQGRTGFEMDVFKIIAAKNETRARQAAEDLKDPLRRIIALAAIYQWKAAELAKATKAKR